MPVEVKNTDANIGSSKSRCDEVTQNGKSIIEEWKNSSKCFTDVLRNDELYEERAIDVIPNYHPHHNILKRNNNIADAKENERTATKTEMENNGTVRSIPIKNYRASIVHNVGTLRKFEAPQLQFESSVSEPEKNFYMTKHKSTSTNDASVFAHGEKERDIARTTRTSRYSETTKPFRKSCHSCYQRDVQGEACHDDSKLRTIDKRIAKSEQNVSGRNGTQEFDNSDDYFRKSPSRRLNESHRKSSNTGRGNESNNENTENSEVQYSKDAETRAQRTWGTVDLERGHVCQKISAYEENARCSGRDWESRCELASEMRKHRTIGVPLVGMHNACGLPVVATWHEHELLEPLRIRTRVVGTLRPIFKSSRGIADVRRKTHPKRKAPQPNQIFSKKNRLVDSSKLHGATIRSLVPPEGALGELTKKKARRPSFKATKVGTYSSRNSLKRAVRSQISTNKENSLDDSFSRRSVKIGSAKRRTLYARDDGEDAVQVLKNLCLNPLAHTKSGADMIW